MLLAEKSHTIQYLPRSSPRGFQTALQVRIFLFQTIDPFRIYACASRRGIDRLDTRFCREGATPECGELIPQVSNELMQLLERFDVRTFAV